jgi:adenosine deaminase
MLDRGNMNNVLLKIPKVELHMHLDGSIPIYALEKLSGLSYEEIFSKVVSINDIKLINYLKRFDFVNSFIKTKEDLEYISYSLGKELEKENVIYAEVRFAPIDYVSNDVTADDVIVSVLKGFSKCNLKTNLILCFRRGSSDEYNRQVLNLAKKYINRGVVSTDLVGDEEGHPFS